MGKKNNDAPEAPDPRETSAAQTGTNVGTAIANTMMGNVNQIGADGSSLTYEQTGEFSFTDPYTKKTYTIPTSTATQKLSEPAQQLYDTNQATQQNLADTSLAQSSFLQDYLGEPWQADTSDIESHLFELGANTLDPKFQKQQSDLQTQLSNQGIKLGSAAYDRAMGELRGTQNDAYNNLALNGRSQAYNELQSQRNQPINEITALLSGSQVSMPNYTTNAPANIATTDNAGLINNAYNQELSAWQQNKANSGSFMGGLFQLGGTLGSAAIMSDERTKTDIEEVGKTNDGQKIYKYRYKAGGPIQMGLMAQEVEKKRPEAVENHGGIKMVDYGKALKGSKR